MVFSGDIVPRRRTAAGVSGTLLHPAETTP
jgi:hypothetical protein